MKILLDECVDRRLASDLVGHEVSTVEQMGWKSKENGELLALAAKRFDVFVTTDRNLSFQQNVGTLEIAVVVMMYQIQIKLPSTTNEEEQRRILVDTVNSFVTVPK